MLRVPIGGEHQEVGADEAQASVRQRLVDHDLRTRRVQLAVADQRHVHVVQSHRADVGSADAAKQQLVALRFRRGGIAKPRSRLAHEPDELAGSS